MIRRVISRLVCILLNIITILLNVFIWRDSKIWLFGAWMGNQFSDNSRFLFQYIHENKNKYNIKEVVWVTRDVDTYNLLQSMGYTVKMMNSFGSYYYHIRSGVHVICNMYNKTGQYEGDIIGSLSFGAKKIQLFHGVGIKACGKMRSDYRQQSTIKNRISAIINSVSILFPGGWNNCYFLATSEEDKRIAIDDYGYKSNRIIIASYPRLCGVVKLLPDEEKVIDIINEKKRNSFKIVLYLPTFREKSIVHKAPRSIKEFDRFIKENKIYWIEKKHNVSLDSEDGFVGEGVFLLTKHFDINVLYPYIDLLITDYSSAASDAVFWGKNTLEYCPDYNEYKENDRGFVAPFENYHVNDIPITKAEDLELAILNEFEYSDLKSAKRNYVRTLLFGSTIYDYDKILKSIMSNIQSS